MRKLDYAMIGGWFCLLGYVLIHGHVIGRGTGGLEIHKGPTVFYGSNIKACDGGATDVPCVDGKRAHAGNITDPTPCVESGPPNEWHCYPTAPLQLIDARDPLITALGKAIAKEEGFGKAGTLATRLHNPGMLVWAGQDLAFPDPLSKSPSGYAWYPTDDAGWAALYADLRAKCGSR